MKKAVQAPPQATALCRLFELTADEVIFQDFSCSMQQGIIYFGRLFIAEYHFLFYASFFAVKQKLKIDIEAVTHMQVQGHSIQLEWTVDGRKNAVVFGAIEDVELVYRFMWALWKGEPITTQIATSGTGSSGIEINFSQKPEDYGVQCKVLTAKLPFSVQDFFTYFLADDSSVYGFQQHFDARGAVDISLTNWASNDQLGMMTRELKASIKVTGVPFKSRSGCHAIHSLNKKEDSLELLILVKMLDVPFSSSFHIEKTWRVTKSEEERCLLQTSYCIKWNSQSYLKEIVEKRTFQDILEEESFWLATVKKRLVQAGKLASFEGEFEKEAEVSQFAQGQQVREEESTKSSAKLQLLFVMVCVLCLLNAWTLFTIHTR